MCHYLATVEGVPIFLWGNLEDDSRTRRERGEESSCSADWDSRGEGGRGRDGLVGVGDRVGR